MLPSVRSGVVFAMPWTASSREERMSPNADKLVAEYLKRLDRELRALPRGPRRELLQEIEEHVAVGRAELPDESEAAIRALLDRIGEPEELAADARERFGVGERAGTREVAAVALVLLGGLFLPVLGWLIGLAFLWGSPVWTRRDKLIGTLLIPGGLSIVPWAVMFLIDVPSCAGDGCPPETTSISDVLVPVLVYAAILIPFAVSVYLSLRLRGRFRHAQR